MKKALFINPFGIGDVLFTTPAIASLKDALPDVFIGYWCNQRVAVLLKGNPRINKVFALSRGDIKKISQQSKLQAIRQAKDLFFALRKENFDTAFDFSLDHRYGLTAKFAGIPRRVGFNFRNRGRFLTDKIELQGYAGCHATEYYLELLRLAGINPEKKNLELFIPAQEEEKAKQQLAQYGVKEGDLVVGFAPGAGESWGENAYLKHWPAENFAQVAQKVERDYGARILVLGNQPEKEMAGQICKRLNKAVNLAGKTTLQELSALIGNLQLLITNDGGPLHMAVALGVKTVSLFGPVDEKVYGPFPPSPKHLVVVKGVDCRPCYRNFKMPECRFEKKCLTAITSEEVYAAARKLLDRKDN